MSHPTGPPTGPDESLGELLTRVRQAHGRSQLRLAEQLCAASGLSTVTRHEISRWEREERVPSRTWLGWLAFVLDVPLDGLERAAAHTRRRRDPAVTTATLPQTGRPAVPEAETVDAPATPGLIGASRVHPHVTTATPSSSGDPGAAARPVGRDPREDGGRRPGSVPGHHRTGPLLTTSVLGPPDHRAAAGPAEASAAPGPASLPAAAGADPRAAAAPGRTGPQATTPARADPSVTTPVTGRSSRRPRPAGHRTDQVATTPVTGRIAFEVGADQAIAALRRTDDMITGPEVVERVVTQLRAALRMRDAPGGPARVAELSQLYTWVSADAVPDRALDVLSRVQRRGVRAALAAGDRPLAAHLIGCHAQTVAERGDGRTALRLALAAGRVAGRTDPATATVVALRLAAAAAAAGDGDACDRAVATAEDQHSRRAPDRDPPWLYWLDDAHLAAATGRCAAALGRPAVALSRLEAAARSPKVRFRAAGLVCAATARAHLGAGDVDAACASAGKALLSCVDTGSFRVFREVRRLAPALRAAVGRGRPTGAVREYAELVRMVRPYLPGNPAAAAAAWPSTPQRVAG